MERVPGMARDRMDRKGLTGVEVEWNKFLEASPPLYATTSVCMILRDLVV